MKNVSVIIPTYKRPSLLSRAIDSVLAQTYPVKEIIVVDDNDPISHERGETIAIMNCYKEYSQVKYILHPCNRGGSAARNTGWRIATGDYITFLDDDDEIAPQKIENQVNCLDSLDNDWGACYTGYHVLHTDGRIQRSATNQQGNVYIRALMRTFYMGSGSNVLYRKSVVDSVGGYDESFKRNQDIEFMVRCFEICKVAFIDKDLMTVHYEVRQFKRSFEFLDSVTEYYLNKFKPRIEALEEVDRHRVISVITLERTRVAVSRLKFFYAVRLLVDNNVKIREIIKYLKYLLHRRKTRLSYGFYLETNQS